MSDEKRTSIHNKKLQETKEWYNKNHGKLERPLDNEDGTISSELIPAYAQLGFYKNFREPSARVSYGKK